MACGKFYASEGGLDQGCLRAEGPISDRQRLARAHWTLWVFFLGLQVADVVTTDYALAVPGSWEANPIMRLSQTHLGVGWWLPKVVAVGFAAAVASRTSRLWPIIFAVSYYTIIVSVNLACL
jgi:Domain of unknown function (DUF5658)